MQVASDDTNYFWRLRETKRLLDWLGGRTNGLMSATAAKDRLDAQPLGSWYEVLDEALEDFRLDVGDGDQPVESFREWLAEWGCELRRRQKGLLLLSAHRAKGLEFDHVVILDGNWQSTGHGEDPDAWRRLFYVSMTRARKTLALARFDTPNHTTLSGAGGVDRLVRDQIAGTTTGVPIPELRGQSAVVHRSTMVSGTVPAELNRRHQTLGLADIHLSYPGRFDSQRLIHEAIRQLSPGDQLTVRSSTDPWQLAGPTGHPIGQLAKQYQPPGRVRSARVHAIVNWKREDSEPAYREGLRCEAWEVVVPEFVFE